MNKKIKIPNLNFLLFLILIFLSPFSFAENLCVKATDYEKLNLVVCTIGKKNRKIERMIDRLVFDLSFTKQFAIKVDHVSSLGSTSTIKNFFKSGFPLVLFIKNIKDTGSIEWRLYDTQNLMMVEGKSYKKRGSNSIEWAHHISDSVWPFLAGQPGFFSTKLAYCKEIHKKGKKVLKHIFISDFDGSNEKLLVSTPTINVAPRWNRDPNNPLLFYSEHTNENVRLVMVDMKGRRKVVSNFDGMNMLPAFSQDGKQVVFCASRGSGQCQLYFYEKGNLKKITHNSGNNIAPNFANDQESLFYCSDFQKGLPQIYQYYFKTEESKRITNGGYCVSPSYCSKNNMLAYSKMIHGTMQIFLYDVKTKSHRQVTFGFGNKDECSWSPCGNYLLFSIEKQNKSRLVMLNINSNDKQFITSGGSVCCYPSWSCTYNNFSVT